MPKIFKYSAISLIVSLTLCVQQNSFAVESGSGSLISTELLTHANLKVFWENELPIKDTESVKQMLILGNRVYVVTNKDFIISLNRENGKIVFSQ